MESVTNFWKSGTRGKILLIGGSLFSLCCLCGLFIYFVPVPGATNAPLPTMTPMPDLPPEVTATTGPTSIPAPTDPPLPTATVTSGPRGVTRDQPHPIDAVIDISGDMKVSIVEVVRPANDVVQQGNMFNDTPVPNQEYIMVKLHVECVKSSNDKCTFDRYEFKTVGADGQVRDQASVAGVPGEFESYAEFFGGSSLDGNIVFVATQNDPNVVLFYEPFLFGDPVYIALQ